MHDTYYGGMQNYPLRVNGLHDDPFSTLIYVWRGRSWIEYYELTENVSFE